MHPDDQKPWGVMALDRHADSSPHSRSVIGAQPAANNDTQYLEMTTPIDHQWNETNSADGRCQRRRVTHVIFAGAAAIAMLALFDATAPLGTGETTVASGSVRLVDQATDVPPPPPSPGLPLPPGGALPPGTVVLPGGMPVPPMPPGTVLPPGAVVLPGGPDLPPLPSPVDLSQLSRPDVQQLWARMLQLSASPPPNVPNEVCRYNTVRVPC